MRSIALGLVFGTLLVFAAQGLVRAEEDEPSAADALAAVAALQGRVEALEAEVDYLRAREASMAAYMLANAHRASGLEQLAAKMRKEGFEAKSIPVASRKTLLEGLQGLAGSLRDGLPKLTTKETKLLKAAEAARKKAAK